MLCPGGQELSFNDSCASGRVAGGMGLGLQTGVGLRVRAGKRNVLLEWRYSQALNNTRGVGFMPLTLGVMF